MNTRPLLLASSSPYRKALLERLRLPFTCASPDIDETALPSESAETLTLRLAEQKARALANEYPRHLIIGSDQVALLPNGQILTKPGHYDAAFQQLQASSGQAVTFLTGLAVLDAESGKVQRTCETFKVHFRPLSATDIEHYLLTEEPYDCAGSFKMEGLGINLFSRFEGRDPNSLIGLPLIALIDLLHALDVDPLAMAYRNSTRD
ncbi:Maf family protein [Marinobacter sp. V034]|uniref:Maf family protein n=1 Tax=Marinobacter sp. V034 TaxID=3459610 RepID=UPI004045084A